MFSACHVLLTLLSWRRFDVIEILLNGPLNHNPNKPTKVHLLCFAS